MKNKLYTLMQKDYKVVDVSISEISGHIEKTHEIHDKNRIPIGIYKLTRTNERYFDKLALNGWWTSRSIPASRQGLQEALSVLYISTPTLLLKKSLGLSLSDSYWIKPKDSDIKWADVNFYDNSFTSDLGELMFDNKRTSKHISLMTPQNASDGWLKKKWVIENNKRYLIKGASGYFEQEPLNEVIGSVICKRLGIPHVTYTAFIEKGKFRSKCENFLEPNTEYVPAWYITAAVPRKNNESLLEHFKRSCKELEVPYNEKQMNQMLIFDYLVSNSDRHTGNFGFIRNTDTLEWIGMAPLFDNGTSLWHDDKIGNNDNSRPFKKRHHKQIQLVTDLEWYEPKKLEDLDLDFKQIFSNAKNFDEQRLSNMIDEVEKRAEKILALKSRLLKD